MEKIIYEVDPPFKFLYEGEETQVLVQTKTEDLAFVLLEFFNFLQACSYEKEDILEELKKVVKNTRL